MKIPLHDVHETATELDYAEPTAELNGILRRGRGQDYEFERPIEVHVAVYRSEQDLFLDGTIRAQATATCARCLEQFTLPVEKEFSLVVSPERPLAGEIELGAADLVQSFYSGPDLDLTPLVYEQVLLALPTRPLCAEECRGLCPQCGASRNTVQCSCAAEAGDPRLAVLRSLKINRGA